MTVQFDNAMITNHRFNDSLAEAISGVLNIAGIHNNEYDQKPLNESSGVFTVTGQSVSAAGAGSFLLCEIENNVLVEGTFTQGMGVMFTTTLGGSGCGVRYYGNQLEFVDDGGTVLYEHEIRGTRLRVGHFEVTDFKGDLLYKIVSVWSGDLFLASHYFTNSSDFATELYIEALSPGTINDITLDDIDIPARAVTVDASEQIQAALNRLFQTESKLPIHLFCRYSGAGKFLINRNRDAIADVSAYSAHAERRTRVRDWSVLRSYVRAVSAWPEADYLDGDIADAVGPAYFIAQNPNITTVDAALEEARRVQDSTEGKHRRLNLTGFALPIIEPGDHLTVDGEKWVLETQDIKFSRDGKLGGNMVFRSRV